MTLPEIAESMNALFRKYGLDHDVFEVKETLPIRLDPRENEPDITKWRASDRATATAECIVLVDCGDRDKMDLLLSTFEYLFQEYFTLHPPSDQLRLF